MKKRNWSFFLYSMLFVHMAISLEAAEVKEMAPGVFFRQSENGCNNGWILFKDYVLVIDANFPDVSVETIQDIRKTTALPIRFVFDTHHHGDHILGNGLFVKEGATIIASRGFLNADSSTMREAFQNWIAAHPQFRDLSYTEPSLFFDEKMEIDDGQQRVELISYGHGHSPADAVAWLPKEQILFTGDLCINGAFNYLGDCHLEPWLSMLDRLQGYDVKLICPGHGPVAGKELLQTQRDYLAELRDQVQRGIDAGKTLTDILPDIKIPVYETWTGKQPSEANIRDMYNLLSGLAIPWELQELNLREGPSPTKDQPGWTPPKKILTRFFDSQAIASLKLVAPGVEFIPMQSEQDALNQIADADAVIGPISPEMLQAASKLRWIHSISAGVEDYLYPELVNSKITLTNGQGLYGPAIADHVLGFMLMFSKRLAVQYKEQLEGKWRYVRDVPQMDLEGKTLLILGLGGIGRQVAQRAAGFHMIIQAVDPQSVEKPLYVQRLVPPDQMQSLLPEADFVVCTVPLTPRTRRYFDRSCFEKMKSSAYFINIGRGAVVNQDDLVQALQSKKIAGAALDVTDPEPLPPDHLLWKMDNVLLTPHMSGRTEESLPRVLLLFRENVRRFALGEPLLNVVDKQAGY